MKKGFEKPFLKYHGCGNDFILIDEMEEEKVPEQFKKGLAVLLCKRRFGVGANSVLYMSALTRADAKMRIFQSHGLEVDMCGNGIRCVADYLSSKLKKNELFIDTRNGIKKVKKVNGLYEVNIGKLRTLVCEVGDLRLGIPKNDEILDRKIAFPNLGEVKISIVRAGEPHGVIFVDDVDKENLVKYGRAIAANKGFFPHGIHVNLAQVIDISTIKIRTYERGAWEETLACGTGAAASAAVSYVTGKVRKKRIKVNVKGGELIVNIVKGSLFLMGPATRVFEGRITIDSSFHQ